LPRPVASMDGLWNDAERAGVGRALSMSAIGSPQTVKAELQSIIERTQADELIVATAVHDHAARLRSYERLAALRESRLPSHFRALRNMRIHGLNSLQSPLVQLISTLRNTRSGCGISTVKRPSAVVTAVRPSGLPFGLNG